MIIFYVFVYPEGVGILDIYIDLVHLDAICLNYILSQAMFVSLASFHSESISTSALKS
jgi:hypothetical protein